MAKSTIANKNENTEVCDQWCKPLVTFTKNKPRLDQKTSKRACTGLGMKTDR